MAVGRDYLLRKPSGPSAPKLFLDTQVVPRAVNVAGSLEVALERAARLTNVPPVLILTVVAAAAVGGLAALLLRPERA